ncbi:uncharacterized protein VTP21DRAFT_6048 [Calcarisporiella thermophila]|uniref:uncharacterized protein n=1 Tax=Calcarisporiella thermophila TaxID=911321 RepID=UPI003743140A
MATRLDRLVLLLDTGTTSSVRATAAQQLGEIQKQHPGELRNLLSRVLVHLRSKSWETRVAAGQAIEAIAKNVPEWNPPEAVKVEEHKYNEEADKSRLTFDNFDIANVIQNGRLLLGSAGKEYDFEMSELDPEERLALQRRNLKQRLGLASQFMEDLLDDADINSFVTPSTSTPATANTSTVRESPGLETSSAVLPPSPAIPSAIPQQQSEADMAGLSARERNRLKRKLKKDAKERGKDKVRVLSASDSRKKTDSSLPSPGMAMTPRTTAPVKTEEAADYFDFTPQPQCNKIVVESKKPPPELMNPDEQPTDWPFAEICDLLCMDLLDHSWEIRHGAGIGLRSILKIHGSGAGRAVGLTKQESDRRHKLWLDDIAVRLLCIFALDRFGDFVSDQVVAPVRETCAQTLGALLSHLDVDSVKQVHSILLRLVHQTDLLDGKGSVWEIRHGGLLGLKYLIAVRRDMVNVLLEGTVSAVILGLQDVDDDVRAVSAATLLPAADSFVELLPQKIPEMVNVLWDCLTDLKDDLTASTANVMDLLSKLFTSEKVLEYMKSADKIDQTYSLTNLIPRLYPFFRHTITTVRAAVLNTLVTFLGMSGLGDWVEDSLLRLVFQNLVVEEKLDILTLSLRVWKMLLQHLFSANPNDIVRMSAQHLPAWFAIIMTPIGTPLDTNLFYISQGIFTPNVAPLSIPAAKTSGVQRRGGGGEKLNGNGGAVGHNVDAGMISQDFGLVTPEIVLRGRIMGAKALGIGLAMWPQESIDAAFKDILFSYIHSHWALQRQLTAVMIEEWAGATEKAASTLTKTVPLAASISTVLIGILEQPQPPFFLELVPVLRRVRGECQALFNTFASEGKLAPSQLPPLPAQVMGEANPNDVPALFTIELAKQIIAETYDILSARLGKTKRNVTQALDERKRRVVASIGFYETTKSRHDIAALSSIAGAVVALAILPAKLNPIVRNIMNSIKFEENEELQQRSASALARLIYLCSSSSRSNPNDKVVKNLCAFLCSDPTSTPLLQSNRAEQGILSIQKFKENTTDSSSSKSSAALKNVPGDLGQSSKLAHESNIDETTQQAMLMRRGAETALKELAQKFGAQLFDIVPKLWECMCSVLMKVFLSETESEFNAKLDSAESIGQEVIDALQVLNAVAHFIHPALHSKITSLLPYIIRALISKYSVIRNVAARCLATVCDVITKDTMMVVIKEVLPYLGNTQNVIHRQGAAEMIYHVVQKLDDKILPYVVFLIVPVLGRMSDVNENVRLVSTNCFALLIKLVPLEAGLPDSPDMPEEMLAHRDREREFLAQLLDRGKLQDFHIPVAINAELRKYQQEGVNWLAFLNKYQLHGILCDDMGLGKTLQSICILSSDHYHRKVKYEKDKSPDAAPMPSLIVCPPTLTGHWYHEITQYTNNLSPLLYTGAPSDRKRLRPKIHKHDVVIVSYDIIRNDIEDLGEIHWNYCILDEGHIIKNAKTKITKAVKTVKANHRLILTGTPVQNGVLELWSLFDFLMPGFLGTEKIFNERFGKPILASKDAKSSSKEQEAGALALEALHKQILPFVLRRLKEDVLHDLPPKIIQDYYCELSDLQKRLYEEFAKSQTKQNLENELGEDEADGPKAEGGRRKATHIFQALQYLRKLCNHPLLVLNEKHPEYDRVMASLKGNKNSLHDVQNAPKLQALRQLLLDCGIGQQAEAEADPMGTDAVSQHRVLIFCQLKTMLDIIENDLFKTLMPSVTYMRLDGSVDANKRHEIVQTFNRDPSIDVLLLTTHVGGLGLNLTGADTVIFVEHDWNPMKDLQAMDRAHRIGQKKVVNVYRLIARGTLEEKIMGLQKFKLNIANSIVNQQNAGLQSMDTDQILDLFNVTPAETGKQKRDAAERAAGKASASAKNVIENLESLWDERQYEEYEDLEGFIQSLNS